MKQFRKIFQILIALTFIFGLLGPATLPARAEVTKAQPLLVQLASEEHDQRVAVIVQKSAAGADLEERVGRLGGEVTRDLHIINAFAAELPAGAAVALAQDPGVRWVSLSSTMVSTTLVDEYVADNFEIRQYNNQDGSQLWSGDWTEFNDDGKADAGKVKIDQEKLRLEDRNRGIQRSLDLSQATSPVLSFNYRRESMNKSQAYVTLAISSDGGATWSLLATFGGPANEANLLPAISYDLTPYASELTTLRFTTSAGMEGRLWVDNLRISFSQPNDQPMFTTWASGFGAQTSTEFSAAANMVDENGLGPDGLFGYGADVKGSFSGFEPTIVEGYKIVRVEAVLYAYIDKASPEETKFKVYGGGSKLGEVALRHVFDRVVGAESAGLVYVNLTNLHTWQYADVNNDLELYIEQKQKSDEVVHYDAIGLRITLENGVDLSSNDLLDGNALPKEAMDLSNLQVVAPLTVRAPQVWNEGPVFIQGEGVTVAVVDSGVLKNKDLGGRKRKDINFNNEYHDAKDRYGHGTLVANLIAGNGRKSNGAYIGIAPESDILNIRISNDQGMSSEAEVVEALGWILDHRDKYNIRVVNLSLNSSVPQDYHASPLCAAVEILWFNGIVVVVSAGNNGGGMLYPPANDPFVITVGAVDDRMTSSVADDQIASFSAYGPTESGLSKPDIVAPGKDLIAHLPKNNRSSMGQQHPERQIGNEYFRVSGTSFAAPIVSGSVALLLQDEPGLTPDQVKFRLMATANKSWAGYDPLKAGAGLLDAYAAVHGTTTEGANTGLTASQLLWTGNDPITWGSVAWNSVAWNSVAWNSVAWNSVAWNSVAWNSDYWGP